MRAVSLQGSPDSGIIIQAGTPPTALNKQVYDTLCGAYRLVGNELPPEVYYTVVREQWAAFGQAHPDLVDEKEIAAQIAPLLTAGISTLSDDDVARVAEAAADEQDRRARERLNG